LIAGLARAPSRTSPITNPAAALARRDVVLGHLERIGAVTAEERAAAAAEPLHLVQVRDVFRQRAPHFTETVRRKVVEAAGEDAILTAGLRIETGLDPFAQAAADHAVDHQARKLDQRQGFRGPAAHLDDEAARAEFTARSARLYGADPLRDEGRWRLGLVTAVTMREVTVSVGGLSALLPLRGMRWASRFDRNSGINDVELLDAREALEPGDVVWVRPAPESWRPAAPSVAAGAVPAPQRPVVQLGQTPRVEAALLTLDPETSYVTASQGGHDFDRSQFNRTVQACRQPGSVFKAIYYAAALDGGRFTMGSVLQDQPYEPEPGEEWNPQNLHGTISGDTLLRNAFIHSMNLSSLRLFLAIGADAVVNFARNLGFRSELIADKALALGASCVRMDELARSFAIFERGGAWMDPVWITRITDKHGRTVVDARHHFDGAMRLRDRLDRAGAAMTSPPRQAVDERTAFLITRLMRDVVTSGIGRQAGHVGVPAAGKSGTASKKENTTDTWFVGFTSRLLSVAWMGDDAYERSLGDEEASYTTATPLWTEFMTEAVRDLTHEQLPLRRPAGITMRVADLITGTEPIPGQQTVALYYREGTEP
jgi:penicillin-binding protein 1A